MESGTTPLRESRPLCLEEKERAGVHAAGMALG
jgi:hypothetical protein